MSEKIFSVDGYIKNNTGRAFFRLQKQLPVGGTMTFEHAFLVLGKRSGLEGKEFIDWLRINIFNEQGWDFFNPDDTPYQELSKEAASVEEPAPSKIKGGGAGKNLRREKRNTRKKGMEISPDSIITADPELAKSMISECKDKVVLKKALTLSKHFSQKEEHMRALQKRLEQVN